MIEYQGRRYSHFVLVNDKRWIHFEADMALRPDRKPTSRAGSVVETQYWRTPDGSPKVPPINRWEYPDAKVSDRIDSLFLAGYHILSAECRGAE